jgi:acetyl-CoA synthetase
MPEQKQPRKSGAGSQIVDPVSHQKQSGGEGATAAAKVDADVSEAQIAVHWKEEEYFYPPAKFIGQANLADPSVDQRFTIERFPECFKEYADMLSWDQYWNTTLDTSNPPFWKWFVGGKLNACYNCVDRHLAKYGNNPFSRTTT